MNIKIITLSLLFSTLSWSGFARQVNHIHLVNAGAATTKQVQPKNTAPLAFIENKGQITDQYDNQSK